MAGHCYDFRRGYELPPKYGKHESAEQFRAFQEYMHMGPKRSLKTVAQMYEKTYDTMKSWAKKYCWDKRIAQWDKEQMALVYKETEKIREKKHKQSIMEFRDASERQARLMMDVAEDLLEVLTKRVKQAQQQGEDVPLPLVAGLLRATANITEQSRQAWASALGVEDMLQLVEQELERVEVEEIDDDEIIYLDE